MNRSLARHVLARVCPALLLAGCAAMHDQRADPAYRPQIGLPAFPDGTGPLICVDGSHHNFHRIDGRFEPFARLARADGFRVVEIDSGFQGPIPADCRLLVIANAQPNDLDWDDYPHPTPAAFTDSEVVRLAEWVRDGGRLLLIADHMPFPGAAAALAAAFDCHFVDGFAVRNFATEAEGRANFMQPTLLTVEAGTLRRGPVPPGRHSGGAVTQVATFVGQAFQCGPRADALLVLPDDYVSLMPEKAWKFTLETPRLPAGGHLQGAAIAFGSGRVAIFGEAGMFTVQVTDDGRPMGFTAPGAEQNERYVLDLIEWLSGP